MADKTAQNQIARINMVKQQCRAVGVLDDEILEVFYKIPREHFVPHRYENLAFSDTQIALGHDQVMLAPKDEARILHALKIQPQETVLEIGTGSGFFTALLAQQAKHVDSIDIFEDFIEAAKKKLADLDIHNISLEVADASAGYKKNNKYDVIIITASILEIPKVLLHQLNQHGRLFVFMGYQPLVEACVITHHSKQKLFETWVPPLIDAEKRKVFLF